MTSKLDFKKLDLPEGSIIVDNSVKHVDSNGVTHLFLFEDYEMTNREFGLFYNYAKMFLPTFPTIDKLTFSDLIKLNAICTLAVFGHINPIMKKKAELFGQKAIRAVIKVLYKRMTFVKNVPITIKPVAMEDHSGSKLESLRTELITIAKYLKTGVAEEKLSEGLSDYSNPICVLVELAKDIIINELDDPISLKNDMIIIGLLIRYIYCVSPSYVIDPGDSKPLFDLLVEIHPFVDDLFENMMMKDYHKVVKDPEKIQWVAKELNNYFGFKKLLITNNDAFNLILRAMMRKTDNFKRDFHILLHKAPDELSLGYMTNCKFKDRDKKEDILWTETTTQVIDEMAYITRHGLGISDFNSPRSNLIITLLYGEDHTIRKIYSFLGDHNFENLIKLKHTLLKKKDEFYYYWEANKHRIDLC